MSDRLRSFDKARIDKGLQKGKEIIEEHGPMSHTALLNHDETAVLALYEALCSVPYLSLPENRVLFNYVFEKIQEKKVLKIGTASALNQPSRCGDGNAFLKRVKFQHRSRDCCYAQPPTSRAKTTYSPI